LSRQSKKRALFYSTALIVILLLLAPFILEKFVNFSIVKEKISFFVKQTTGVQIDQDEIDFIFYPRPGVRFNKIELSFGDVLQLDIGAINVDVDISKLLKGKFAVSKIFVDSPDIRYTLPGDILDSQTPVRPFYLKFPKEEIQRLFALFPDSQDTLEIVIHNIHTDHFQSMDGSFFVTNTRQSMTFSAQIRGLDIRKNQFSEDSPLQKIDINRIKSKKINIIAKLDGKGILTGNFQVTAPKIFTKQIPDKALSCDLLDFKFHFSRQFSSFQLKPVLFSYPHARVGINFTDDRKAKKTKITFTGNDIDIEQAGKACLNLMGSNEVAGKLFDILRGGRAKKVTVGFTGNTIATLFAGKNLFLAGSAESCLVKIPETPLIAKKVDGDAVLKNGILHIKARKGQVTATLIRGGWLDIDLLNHEDIPFKGEFKLHTDLSTLPELLRSLLPGTLLSRELAKVSGVKGQADAILKLGMESMQKDLFVHVTAKNLLIKGYYDPIGLPITITSGHFLYENDKVVLKKISGSLKDSSVKNLNAVIDFSQFPYFDIDTGPARINMEEIMGWLKSYDRVMELILPVKKISGNLFIESSRLSGPIFEPENWKFEAKGSGRDINIKVSQKKGENPDNEQINSVSGRFHLTDEMVRLQGVKAQIKNLSWIYPAIDMANLSSIKLPIEIFETNFKVVKTRTQLQGKISFPLGGEFFFDLAGKNIADLFPRLLILQDKEESNAIVMFNRDPLKPLIRFEGILNTRTLEKIFIKDSFLDNLVFAYTAGNPIQLFTDTNSDLHVNLEKINLDSLLAIGNQVKKSGHNLFDNKTLYVNVGQLTYKKMVFRNVKTRIDFTKDKTQIYISHANLCDLAVTGMVQLPLAATDNQVITNFAIQPFDNKNIEDMMSCLFKNNNIITGSYSFTCQLSGQASSKIIFQRQNGTLTLKALNGRIYKWTFLSRLLSVLNILHFTDITKEGIGYSTIMIEADIKDSIIYLKKAVVEADNMALIASGRIDPLNDNIDITCLVAPLKTIDDIIKYIPVINTMLSGRLVSFPARATGSLTDPTIIPLAPSAVGKGLINMLGDILKTPVKIFEESP